MGGHHISMQEWILFIEENHEQDPCVVMMVNYRQLAGHRRPQVVGPHAEVDINSVLILLQRKQNIECTITAAGHYFSSLPRMYYINTSELIFFACKNVKFLYDMYI